MNVAQAATAALSISKSISCIFGPPRPFRPSRASGLRSHFVAVLAPRSASRNLLFGPPRPFGPSRASGLRFRFAAFSALGASPPPWASPPSFTGFRCCPPSRHGFPFLFYFTMKKRPPQRATPSSTPAGRSRPPSAGPPDWGFPPARRSSPSAAPPARRLPRSDRRCPGGSRRIGRWRRSGCPPAPPASGPAGR